MPLSLSQASVTLFNQMLASLSHWLDKAETMCAARKIGETVLPGTRLAPDMLALAKQVQIACDFAKNTVARLAGVEPMRFEDTETTLAQLKDRVARALAYLNSIPVADVDAGTDRQITFPAGPDKKASMRGVDYLQHYALPNFFFHTTTAYNILRHSGVEIGKRDFLGAVPGFKFI